VLVEQDARWLVTLWSSKSTAGDALVEQEHEPGLNDRHVLQLMRSKIQIREQLKRAAVDQGHEAEVKENYPVQLHHIIHFNWPEISSSDITNSTVSSRGRPREL
jgi:hypothetical protein